MPTPAPRKFPPWLQVLLVMALAWAGVATIFGRLTWEHWTEPVWLEGDPLEIYARVGIAAEQPWHALTRFAQVERLGAPVAADWSGYPVPDRLVFVLTGLLSQFTGVIAAVHLLAAFITGLNALSFYQCARWLRWRWEWAVAFSLVFALSSYNLRWGISLSLNQTFLLPPLVLLCARATRRAPWSGDARLWRFLAVALGLWLGLANPYLAFFAGLVAGGALVLALIRRSPKARLFPLGCFLACLMISFGVGNAGYLARYAPGMTDTTLVRGVGDSTVYALNAADWVVPPADHRTQTLAALGQAYVSFRRNASETSYNYLGIAGLAGLLLLLGRGSRQLLRRRWPRADPLLGLGWIFLFGVAGGTNSWLGAAGLTVFRAGGRIGVYALVWVLFSLGGWFSRLSRRLPRLGSVGCALLFAFVSIWEQTPALADRTGPAHNQVLWKEMAALTRFLEDELPAGAKIFQLPATPFPEAGPVGAMTDYQHILPFLTSHSLHFSYGQPRPSPWLRWARHVERLPAAQLVAALEQTGFSLLWIDRRAYADAGASLARGLRETGSAEIMRPGIPSNLLLFRLKPSSTPCFPDLNDPRLGETWDPAGPSVLLAQQGWYPLESQSTNRWRWAVRQAVTGIWHDGPPVIGTIRFQLGGPSGSTVTVSKDGRDLWRGQPGTTVHEIQIPLSTGLTTLQWALAGRTFRPGGHDSRELGFMVENLSLSVP